MKKLRYLPLIMAAGLALTLTSCGDEALEDALFGLSALSIKGTTAIGSTLTAEITNVTDTSDFSYQWILIDADKNQTNIPNAKSQKYTIPNDETLIGQKLKVQATKDGFVLLSAAKTITKDSSDYGPDGIPGTWDDPYGPDGIPGTGDEPPDPNGPDGIPGTGDEPWGPDGIPGTDDDPLPRPTPPVGPDGIAGTPDDPWGPDGIPGTEDDPQTNDDDDDEDTTLPVPAIRNSDTKDLSLKFGVTINGNPDAEIVTYLFKIIHAYIQTDQFTVNSTNATSAIKLGDYIDLPVLWVEPYLEPTETDQWAGGIGCIQRAYMTPYDHPGMPTDGSNLIRLIVVGINSFHSGRGYNGGYDLAKATNVEDNAAAKAYNDATPHIVFQFQHAPTFRRMTADKNTYGYERSEMRVFLTENFADALNSKLCGVPIKDDSIIWAPKRYVAHPQGTQVDLIQDKLWLPTYAELRNRYVHLGNTNYSYTDAETVYNQTHLEYYDSDDKLMKYNWSGETRYWVASPARNADNTYLTVARYHMPYRWGRENLDPQLASEGLGKRPSYGYDYFKAGVSPAFCVK